MRVAVLFAAVLSVAGCAAVPREAAEGAAWRGRDVAARNCAGCHNVNREGESLLRAAPPFRLFDPESPAAIRDFAGNLRRHHPDGMPEILLTDVQARDLYAYVRSLQSGVLRDRLPDVPHCFMRIC